MRILLTVHTFFPHWVAGTEVYALNVARGLRQQGHDVQFVCYEPRQEAPAKLESFDDEYDGFPVHRILFNKVHPDMLLREYYHSEVEEHLLQFVPKVRPDVVHVIHTMHLSAATLTATQRLGLPLVCTAMDFWYICPTFRLVRVDGSICPGPVNFLQCKRCYNPPAPGWKRTLVEAVASSDRLTRVFRLMFQAAGKIPGAGSSRWVRASRHIIERPKQLREILHGVDLLIVPNRHSYQILVQNGVTARRMMILGFGLPHLAEGVQAKKPSQRLRLGYIGTLDQIKGVHVLLEAVQRLAHRDDLELVVYGDPRHYPDYYRRLQALAASNPRIRFGGTFPNEKIGVVLSEIDLLVIPSLWYENTPLVQYSAFAAKTPVLVSNIGSLGELVRHGENGLVFQMGNADDLARQIEKVLEDRSLLDKLQQGIEPVKSIEQNVQELLEIYAALSVHSAVAKPKIEVPSLSRHVRAIRDSQAAGQPKKSLAERLRLRLRRAQFDDWLELHRCDYSYEPTRRVNLCFAWEWTRPPEPNLAVFVHFLNNDGAIAFQADHSLKDVLPQGETGANGPVTYPVAVQVPEEVSRGWYIVRVGVWIPSDQRFLVPTRTRGWSRDRWQGIRLGRVKIS